MVHNTVFGNIIKNDVRLLEENKVKDVTVTDAGGKVLSKMSFNKRGWIKSYYASEHTYGKDGSYDFDWDDKDRLSKGIYKYNGMTWVYYFNYTDYTLNVISLDFQNGINQDYIFKYKNVDGNDLFDKLSYHDKSKDTFDLTCIFNYDEKGKLIKVNDSRFFSTFDSVSYGENTIFLAESYFEKCLYTIDNSRIVSEERIYPSDQRSRAYIPENRFPDIKAIKKYLYKENGLIDLIEEDMGGDKYRKFYEYTYYD